MLKYCDMFLFFNSTISFSKFAIAKVVAMTSLYFWDVLWYFKAP